MNLRQSITIAALLLSLDQYAQFMQREIEEPSFDWYPCISRTLDGGELIGGSDSLVAVITKMNAAGHVQWAMRYPEVDDIVAIGTFPEGDHYALGMNFFPDNWTSGTWTTRDYVILQLDTSGQVNWSRVLSGVPFGSNNAYGFGITHDMNGDLIVTPATKFDTHILRISRTGDTKWSVQYPQTSCGGGGVSTVRHSAQPGPAGTVYTSAIGDSCIGFNLFATDTLGQCLWSRRYRMPADFAITEDLLVTTSGQLVIVGWIPELIPGGLIATADTLGNLLGPVYKSTWFSGNWPDSKVFELAQGQLAVTGMCYVGSTHKDMVAFYDGSGNYSGVVTGEQLFRSAYDIGSDGSFSSASFGAMPWPWLRFTRGNVFDQILCTQVPVTITSTPVIPNEFLGSTPIPGPLPAPYAVTAVPFMPAEQDYCGTVALPSSQIVPSLSIDPVPAADRITVNGWGADHGPTICTLIDARGQEVLRVPVATTSGSIVVDVSSVPPGTYAFTITGAEQRWVGRCMIAR